MSKVLIRLFLVTLCLLLVPSPYAASPLAPPQEGGRLPDFSLSVPDSNTLRQYLGLDAEGMFKIPDIDASVVIIEIFSMY